MFGRHLNSTIIKWLEEEDNIGVYITGMSGSKFNKLKDRNVITEEVTVVDLRKKEVVGGKSSKLLKRMFDQAHGQETQEAANYINTALTGFTEMAYRITSLMTLRKAKEVTKRSINQAQKSLIPFGKRAKALSNIAEYIINRKI